MVVERDLEEPAGKRRVRDQGWVAWAPLNRRRVRRVALVVGDGQTGKFNVPDGRRDRTHRNVGVA